jgi:hypothetical protein
VSNSGTIKTLTNGGAISGGGAQVFNFGTAVGGTAIG